MNNKIISFRMNCGSYKGKKWGFLLTFIMFFSLLACGQNGSSTTWQEQYDLGIRYLSEGSYEEAIITFTAAIEIDPKNADAYIGAAKAYEAMGDIDSALSILQQGLDATGSEDILALIEELSGTHNLTGAKMFTPADLEAWGFPYGCSIYDLAAQGWCTQAEIDKVLEEQGEPWAGPGYGIEVARNPIIYVGPYNGLICGVDINNDNSTLGPHGVRIGMNLAEVLSLFYCENNDVLTYAKAFEQELIVQQETDLLQLYYVYYEHGEDHEWHRDNAEYYGGLFFSDNGYYLKFECGAGDSTRYAICDLVIHFDNGTVDSIEISYQYDDFDIVAR